MPHAPVALFVYNRPEHARRTLDALRANPLARETDLYVYSDGPKREDQAAKVAELRAYLRSVSGFRSVTLVEREKNLGLANSVIAGVTEVIGRHGKIIVLEDDMVTSPHFLAYMNDGLDVYRDAEDVISVAAYIYPVTAALPTTFFLRGADCWGWGTWKRGWDLFEPDGKQLLDRLEAGHLTRAFDMDGSFRYSRMLRRQIEGRNDSWAIRWYASAFILGKLTLYPGTSLLHNIGNDGEGTHCSDTDFFDVAVAKEPVRVEKLPAVEDKAARAVVREYFLGTWRGPGALFRRALDKVLGR